MDPGSMVLAGTGLITGLGALYVNWRSQRDQSEQQTVATRVVEDKTELDKTKQIVDQLSEHNSRLILRAETAEERLANQSGAAEQAAARLRDALDAERVERQHLMAAQETRCREVQSSMVETLVVMRAVVNDEIARSAADMAIRQPMHPHDIPEPPAIERGTP